MTTQISPFWLFFGLAGLASVFYLLQRLRVRQRAVTVETTLFWKDAIEDARARVFVQRFRHPWVYAFLLLIASLLWLGFAGLESGGQADGRQVVLIDASASMTAGDRFARTIEAVEDHVRGLSPANRWVILCGARPQTLLRPGEAAELLGKRLEGIEPDACPATVERILEQTALASGAKTTVCVAGAARVSQSLYKSLPDGVEVVSLDLELSAVGDNDAISSFGFAPAASGQWDRVDVLVEVASSKSRVPAPILTMDDSSVAVVPQSDRGEGTTRFTYRDLLARGQTLRARIADGGSVALDDAAQLRIPDRRPLAVMIDGDVPDTLVRALQADPGITIVTDRAQVVVRTASSTAGGNLPALVVADEASQADGILAIHPAADDPAEVLVALHEGLGLAEIDASDLARDDGGRITMGASPGSMRALKVWRSLFTDEFNFTRSRAFPLFVGMGVRWLAAFVPAPESAAVGVELALGSSEVRDEDGRVFNTLGDNFRPVRAGRFTTDAGVEFIASYLAQDAAGDSGDTAALKSASSSSTGGSLVSFILLVAMALILTEWVLYRQGRIP